MSERVIVTSGLSVLALAVSTAFWEVLVRSGNSASWKLVTPPGVAPAHGSGSLSLGDRAAPLFRGQTGR